MTYYSSFGGGSCGSSFGGSPFGGGSYGGYSCRTSFGKSWDSWDCDDDKTSAKGRGDDRDDDKGGRDKDKSWDKGRGDDCDDDDDKGGRDKGRDKDDDKGGRDKGRDKDKGRDDDCDDDDKGGRDKGRDKDDDKGGRDKGRDKDKGRDDDCDDDDDKGGRDKGGRDKDKGRGDDCDDDDTPPPPPGDDCDDDDTPPPPPDEDCGCGSDAPSCSFLIDGEVQVQVTLVEQADGSLAITFDVLDTTGKIGDLRGAYLDLPSNDLIAGLTVSGDDVTKQKIHADSVTALGGGNNVNGEVAGTFGGFDVGVSFGTSGIGKDDIRSSTIVLTSDAGPLKVTDFSGLDFAVRLTSVGAEGGARCDSLKLGATAPALDCVACDDPNAVKIDFEGLAAGDSPTNFYAGVTITAQRFSANTAQDDAMVFDSNNPTGGDTDLRTTGQGNILIVSEDNDAGDPDDAIGGKITFTFDTPAQILSLAVVDTEEGGSIEAFDLNGTSLGVFAIPQIADGAISSVGMNVTGVARLEVTLNGSGAIDDLCYIPGEEAPPPPATAGLGDYVWREMDCDGVQGAADQGLNGVTVNLLDTTGNILATTTTDTNVSTGLDGYYEFTGIDAGDYVVEFVDTTGINGLHFVTAGLGTDDALDSDAGVDGRTGVITLAAGEFNDTIDAGLVLCYDVPDTADQLLGIAGSEFRSNADLVNFDNNGDVIYTFNAGTGELDIDLNVNLPFTGLSVPTQTTTITNPFTGQVTTVTSTKAAVSINATLDSSGSIVDGADGFVFFNDLNGNDTVDSGEDILLTGNVSAFGGNGNGASTDSYELIVEVTGGTLAAEVDTKFLGLTLSSEFSNFTGNFDTSFAGEGKGQMFGFDVDCICN